MLFFESAFGWSDFSAAAAAGADVVARFYAYAPSQRTAACFVAAYEAYGISSDLDVSDTSS